MQRTIDRHWQPLSAQPVHERRTRGETQQSQLASRARLTSTHDHCLELSLSGRCKFTVHCSDHRRASRSSSVSTLELGSHRLSPQRRMLLQPCGWRCYALSWHGPPFVSRGPALHGILLSCNPAILRPPSDWQTHSRTSLRARPTESHTRLATPSLPSSLLPAESALARTRPLVRGTVHTAEFLA